MPRVLTKGIAEKETFEKCFLRKENLKKSVESGALKQVRSKRDLRKGSLKRVFQKVLGIKGFEKGSFIPKL